MAVPSAENTATQIFHATPFAPSRAYEITGDRLSRPPKGYDPDHPLIETLKLKDVTAFARYTQKEITAGGFIDRFAGDCRAGAPMVKFICEALDVPF